MYALCPFWNGTQQDNGNPMGMNIWHGTTTFSQAFSYDTVNRLTAASDNHGWAQAYNYDQFGNMWMPGANGLPSYGPMPTANLYNGNNQNPNLSYDRAGNQTALGALNLSYDTANRQVGAVSAQGGGGDGHGR